MRKKSHISLAKYIVESLGDEELKKHKYSFYLGSILPDIKPSFIYRRHEITETFHYLADYFTFPHNKIYPGGLKDHCSYEEKLKKDLRTYIKNQTEPHHKETGHFLNAGALCEYIQKAHDDYIGRKHNVEDDIRHIVEVNHRAIQGMMNVLAEKRAERYLKHS